jgi:hypothetical protein
LRSARRTTQENADTALADRQTYLDTIEQQRKELSVLRERTAEHQTLLQDNTQLSDEVRKLLPLLMYLTHPTHTHPSSPPSPSQVMSLKDALQLMRSDYETRLASITALYQTSHRQLSDNERTIYDLESRLESNQSDLKASQQELSSRVRELENLHQVIQSMDREAAHSRHRSEELWQDKIVLLQREWREKAEEESRELQRRLLVTQEELAEARRLLGDERLLKRKFEIEMVSEKKKLHTTLQHALSQLQNSQNDSIDRLLIKNLILRYFQQKRYAGLWPD